ncbi:MAG TPA: DedA family protein [Terriglobia bacterium]|nr:DedA family protein [Terriglobia bacterium]
MAHQLFHFLSWLFARYGYGAVFFGVMLENAGLPLPGETVLLFGGLLAHRGVLDLKWVMAAAATGATLGSGVGYAAGYRWGTPLVRRFSRRAFVPDHRFDQSANAVARYGVWAVFVSRFVIGLRMLAGLLAGAFHLSWAGFMLANVMGACAWAVAMGSVGYALGSSWRRLLHFTRTLDWIAIGVVVLILLVILLRKHRAMRRT